MDDRRLDDILARIDRIERFLEDHSAWHQEEHERGGNGCRCRCHEHHRGHHHHHHDHHHGHRGCCDDERRDREGRGTGFEEKRLVDLIVRLVAEKVEQLLDRHEQKKATAEVAASQPASDPPSES